MNSPVQLGTRPVTPLWIIALFISFTEAVLGYAVIQTAGNIQAALTTFVIVFPFLVAILFFFILYTKPAVLYPPTEFGQGTDVTTYVSATQRRSLDQDTLYATIREEIRNTLASENIVRELADTVTPEATEASEENIKVVLDRAVNRTVEKIRERSFLTIDPRQLPGRKEATVYQVAYRPYLTVDELLGDVRDTLRLPLPLDTYGKAWALKDRKTEKEFRKIGPGWFGGRADARTLDDVGIKAGMHLEVIFILDERA